MLESCPAFELGISYSAREAVLRPGFQNVAAILSLTISQAFAQAGLEEPATQALSEPHQTVMRGNTHPLARPEFDRGTAPGGLPMERMLLVLKRSPEQESALRELLDEQLDPHSPNFHRWLTPDEFGWRFGASSVDIRAVTSWLESQGFQVAGSSKGRTVIEFSGSASQVQQAFRTPIHRYLVNGEEHWANAADPQMPRALAGAVAGIASLHDFEKRPLIRALGGVRRSPATGQLESLTPLVTIPSPCGAAGFQTSHACYGVGPYDFAAIYNVLPLWNAGIDGSGQSIAIAAASDVNLADVRNFRSVFGLPARDPVVIVNGRNPGVINRPQAFEKEAIADVEWAGGTAPGATIQVVVSASTNSTSGFDLSVQYAVDNNLAPVLSASYSFCEPSLGAAGNQFYRNLWQQASAQGMTVLIGTGDGGSAECDYESGASPPAPARAGLSVNGVASTPYNVAVGGTDFGDLTTAGVHWSSTNDSATHASAKGYIPETTWNDSCTNALFGTIAGYNADPEVNCNNGSLSRFVQTAGGTGGRSAIYTKPGWQAGAGVPLDGLRDVPDISLFAGSAVSGSFYLFCEADLQNGAPCSLSGPGSIIQGAAGTSISAPAFAGIMAMIAQNTNSRQGNPNPVLYRLAAQQGATGCDASGAPSAACIFHDVTAGTIAMPCAKGSPNCVVKNAADQYGILSGFDAGAGYDLATGLGSFDAFNLVTAAGWGTGNAATPAISGGGVLNAASFTAGAAVAPGSIATVFGSFPVGATASASEFPLPLMLAGLSLKFAEGFPVPLLFASSGQVNIQVPWELASRTEATLNAGIGGVASAGQSVSLAPFAPGIFAINGQGYGQGAVLDASYRLVDGANPTTSGAAVQIYCTGLGAVTNQPATGSTAPSNPPAVTIALPRVMIGNAPAKVLFSGLAPGFAGLYQVNAEVPAEASRGAAVSVTIFAGEVASNTVTIAVR
jgi:uncharacterized protein (TIGR03437 family)